MAPFPRLGVKRVPLTGGEPLLRPDLPAIVEGIAACPAIDRVALSTNGMRLAPLARTLRTAGLRTVNVSLDSLDAQAHHEISGGHLGAVLAG